MVVLKTFILLLNVYVIYCLRGNELMRESRDNRIYEQFLDTVWDKYGGKNVTMVKKVEGCKRKALLGDTVTFDVIVKVSHTGDTIREEKYFSIQIDSSFKNEGKFAGRGKHGNGRWLSSKADAYFVTRGSALINMCVGDVRKVIIPYRWKLE